MRNCFPSATLLRRESEWRATRNKAEESKPTLTATSMQHLVRHLPLSRPPQQRHSIAPKGCNDSTSVTAIVLAGKLQDVCSTSPRGGKGLSASLLSRLIRAGNVALATVVVTELEKRSVPIGPDAYDLLVHVSLYYRLSESLSMV